ATMRPLSSTTTAVTAMSSCAAWPCAVRTIWMAFSAGIGIVVPDPLSAWWPYPATTAPPTPAAPAPEGHPCGRGRAASAHSHYHGSDLGRNAVDSGAEGCMYARAPDRPVREGTALHGPLPRAWVVHSKRVQPRG